jgi:hypothetical protein
MSTASYLKSPPQTTAQAPRVIRDGSGNWHYEGTDVPAVGARDITLAEVINPRVIARSDGDPEAVLLSLTEIESDQRLLWALPAGTRLDGDAEPLYKIPWEVWQEHGPEPVSAWLPEWHGTGLDRSLATAERECRFAKQALDEAAARRLTLVLLADRLGRSRRVVGKTLSLSAARIQQLNESPPEEIVRDVEGLLDYARRFAILIGTGACPRDELPRPRDLGADEFAEIIDSMIAAGLMEEEAKGLRLTKDGRTLLEEKDGRRKPVKSDRDRERAGDATR